MLSMVSAGHGPGCRDLLPPQAGLGPPHSRLWSLPHPRRRAESFHVGSIPRGDVFRRLSQDRSHPARSPGSPAAPRAVDSSTVTLGSRVSRTPLQGNPAPSQPPGSFPSCHPRAPGAFLPAALPTLCLSPRPCTFPTHTSAVYPQGSPS